MSVVNFRNKYEVLEHDVCKDEEETQKHILEYDEILKNTCNNIKETEYEEFFKVKNQKIIAKMFIVNMKIRKQIVETTWKGEEHDD